MLAEGICRGDLRITSQARVRELYHVGPYKILEIVAVTNNGGPKIF
jgi:hypothetical protein